MKHISTLFLKIVIFLIGAAVLAFMIRFPQTEGRAVNLDLISIYTDPLIIYGYVGITPFFVGLYNAFKLLRQIEKNKTFSQISVKALNNIKHCALVFLGFIIGGEAWVILSNTGDDMAGAIAMGIFITFVSLVVATSATVFQKILQDVRK